MKRRIGKDKHTDVVWANAQKWIGEITEENSRELALDPCKHFKTLKELLPGDWTDANIEGKFLSSLGFCLGRAIELTSDWTFSFVLFEETGFKQEEGVWSILSPNKGTLIYPIGSLYSDYYGGRQFSGGFAQAIYSGTAPDNPCNSFSEWQLAGKA